jgi:hypothetical protein
MKKLMLLCGAAMMAIPVCSSAETFPLEFKTLDAQQAMAFPGGSGTYGQIRLKAERTLKEPKAISRHPLYGQLGDAPDDYAFRLDESKGTGKGYDRLIVDLNRNGDLTDDAVVERVPDSSRSQPGATTLPQMALFGPIPVPDNKKIGDWRPIYFAQMYLYLPASGFESMSANTYAGQLRLKAGWYLETTVKLDGITRKVGIVDGDSNLRLGDVSTPMNYKSDNVENWYFQNGDYILQDTDNSGKFENSVADSDSAPFGPMVYFGSKPYKVTLAADCKSLAVEEWSEPLATLVLQPHGEQVSELQVAWESKPNHWQLLQPRVVDGKALVPPGQYRLYTCRLKVKTDSGDTLLLSGYKRLPKDTVGIEAGASANMRCGSPLEIKVSSQRDSQNSGNQLIRASVLGAGGETFSSFLLQGKGRLNQPPKPVFTVLAADGKEVGSGDMEFG